MFKNSEDFEYKEFIKELDNFYVLNYNTYDNLRDGSAIRTLKKDEKRLCNKNIEMKFDKK